MGISGGGTQSQFVGSSDPAQSGTVYDPGITSYAPQAPLVPGGDDWYNTLSNLANQAQYGGGTGYMGMLDRMAQGYGSAAEARMRASGQTAAQNARSVASSSYGVNPLAARRMALNQGQQAVLQANQQAGVVAAQQAQQARAQLAQLMQYYMSLNMSADEAAMAAAMQWEAMQTQQGTANAKAAAAATAADTGYLGPILGATGAVLGGAVGGPAGAGVGMQMGSSVGGGVSKHF